MHATKIQKDLWDIVKGFRENILNRVAELEEKNKSSQSKGIKVTNDLKEELAKIDIIEVKQRMY